MNKDVYTLAALALCYIEKGAADVRQRCDDLVLSATERTHLLDAVTALYQECEEKVAQWPRDDLGRPLNAADFDSWFFKYNCYASAKDSLASKV